MAIHHRAGHNPCWMSHPHMENPSAPRAFRGHAAHRAPLGHLEQLPVGDVWSGVTTFLRHPKNVRDKFVGWLIMIWVWVKIRYPNNWMVNTKLDIHICGPLGLPFWPTSIWGYTYLLSWSQTIVNSGVIPICYQPSGCYTYPIVRFFVIFRGYHNLLYGKTYIIILYPISWGFLSHSVIMGNPISQFFKEKWWFHQE